MRRLLCLIVVTTVPVVQGCGTVSNLAKPDRRKPYGGVKTAVGRLDGYVDLIQENDPTKYAAPSPGPMGYIGLGLAVADLALSAVGDTLTYPFCKWASRR